MASVTSLDGDLRRMRLDKYTPGAAREARSWIEDVLGEPLAPGDLLDALKDGVALCRLANMAIPPPGIRFKKSAMPFVQMENISHFLRACQAPPLNLQQHDTFLTVDLYEAKDPAQVLQCLGAFSRAANKANPSAFPAVIGARPATSATAAPAAPASPPGRGTTPSSGRPMPSIYSSRTPLAPARSGEGVSSRWNPTKDTKDSKDSKDERSLNPNKSPSSASISSWSKRELEGATAPAWNIAQYGYMGGASQGNLGISFGGRRQITSAGPTVPSAVQKDRLRKEKEAEEVRAKQLMEEEAARRRAALEAEEERARHEELLRWEEETERQRVAEKQRVEEEKRKWEEEERQWKLTEEARKREEEAAEARLAEERRQLRLRNPNSNKGAVAAAAAAATADLKPKLNGQFLSQYQAENSISSSDPSSAYTSRVRELEKELEEARQREQAYQMERQGRTPGSPDLGSNLVVDDTRTRSRSRGARSRSRPRAVPNLASPPVRQESWSRHDEEVLLTPRSRSRHRFADAESQPQPIDHYGSPLPGEEVDALAQFQSSQPVSPRPLPDPRNHFQQSQQSQNVQPPPLPQRLQKQRTGEYQQQPQSPPQSVGSSSFFQKMRAGEQMAPSTENMPTSSSPLRAQRTGDGPSLAAKSQGRPLPDPKTYASPPQLHKELPVLPKQPLPELPPQPTYSHELLGGGVAEHDAEDRRRRQQAYNQQHQQQQQQSPQRPRGPFGGGSAPTSPTGASSSTPGGGASRPGKSLLEREMELERQRQREWEEAQRETAAAPRQAEAVEGVNGRWDVNQWNGYTGGDSQNRGSQGIGSGRRPIVGPRPLPSLPGQR